MTTDGTCGECGQRIEVNADGDSIADMRAVQDTFGPAALDFRASPTIFPDEWQPPGVTQVFSASIDYYRIRAKHASEFDAACMDFGTWAKGVLKRGMAIRHQNHAATPGYWTAWNDDRVGVTPLLANQCCGSDCTWTAITPEQMRREQAEAEQAAAPQEPTTPDSVTVRGVVVLIDSEFLRGKVEARASISTECGHYVNGFPCTGMALHPYDAVDVTVRKVRIEGDG